MTKSQYVKIFNWNTWHQEFELDSIPVGYGLRLGRWTGFPVLFLVPYNWSKDTITIHDIWLYIMLFTDTSWCSESFVSWICLLNKMVVINIIIFWIFWHMTSHTSMPFVLQLGSSQINSLFLTTIFFSACINCLSFGNSTHLEIVLRTYFSNFWPPKRWLTFIPIVLSWEQRTEGVSKRSKVATVYTVPHLSVWTTKTVLYIIHNGNDIVIENLQFWVLLHLFFCLGMRNNELNWKRPTIFCEHNHNYGLSMWHPTEKVMTQYLLFKWEFLYQSP